jgi:hypothetical protein
MARRSWWQGFSIILVLALFFVPTPAYSQKPVSRTEPDVPEKKGKELRAFPVGDKAPRIDGKLDDEAWTAADRLEDLVQNDPDNMAAPKERTVIQVAYDDRAIYVAARCYMADPSKITTALGRRDTNPRSDMIRISFDPRHDHLTAYTFDANPSGVQGDMTWYDDTRSSSDYDAVWEVQTQITSDGWTAEYRIPFSQMRFSLEPGLETVWGFNIRRDTVGTAEVDRWVATPRGVNGFVSRFGHLRFPTPPAPPRKFEVQPFLLGREEHTSGIGFDQGLSGGVDLRVGLGTSATLSATANPDFGQVEQDPAVLNLSVFETFFPEKRPFFIEDSRTLVPSYPMVTTFHSRRIGQRPGRFALQPGDKLIERPDQTTILGATKVTGKASGWTYGGLTALTDREYAKVDATTVDVTGREQVARTERLIEPYTSFNVGRVQRDIFGGSSNVGAIATAVVREKDLDAYTGGVDYTLRWDKNKYTWNGHWVGTRAPIGSVVKTGFGGVTNFNYNSKHLGLFGHYDYFDRNFKNTDIGFFQSRNNRQASYFGVNYFQPDPRKTYRSLNLFFGGSGAWNGDGLVLDHSLNIGGNVEFLNFWNVFAGGGVFLRSFDDLDTRGGPPILRPAGWFFNSFVGSDSRKKWQLSGNTSMSGNDEGGWSRNANIFLRYQPKPRLQTTLSANYSWGEDAAQWITNTDVTGDGQVDHVYGRLKRNVVSVTGRATYAFTRDMTLEVYLQPFVAVGDYHDIRRLARPKSFDFEPASIDTNPDFNSKSFRSNVVFRWEYLRGSSLFVVWNVSNADSSRPGEFSPFRDLTSGFGAAGTQVFMVKLNYWLGL